MVFTRAKKKKKKPVCFKPLTQKHSNKLTHVIVKVHYGHVLRRAAEDLTNFAKMTKVLLKYVLLVEDCWHIFAKNDVAISRRTTVIQWGFCFSIWVQTAS